MEIHSKLTIKINEFLAFEERLDRILIVVNIHQYFTLGSLNVVGKNNGETSRFCKYKRLGLIILMRFKKNRVKILICHQLFFMLKLASTILAPIQWFSWISNTKSMAILLEIHDYLWFRNKIVDANFNIKKCWWKITIFARFFFIALDLSALNVYICRIC